MSKTEKPKEDNQQASAAEASEGRSYYVPHLKKYRAIKELTQQDRESIADNLFGPNDPKA